MKHLEDELRDVFRRKQPPAGFAERVLRRLKDASPQRHTPPRRRRFMLWAAAAMLVVAVGGGIEYRSVQKAREERARGEAAKEEVLHALRIAGSKLQFVREKIKEVGSS